MRCRASISSCQWFAICVGSSDRRRATRKAASIIVSIRPVGVGARIRVRRRPARRTISIMIIRPRLKWTVCVRQWRVWPKWTSWAAIEQQKAALTHSLTHHPRVLFILYLSSTRNKKNLCFWSDLTELLWLLFRCWWWRFYNDANLLSPYKLVSVYSTLPLSFSLEHHSNKSGRHWMHRCRNASQTNMHILKQLWIVAFCNLGVKTIRAPSPPEPITHTNTYTHKYIHTYTFHTIHENTRNQCPKTNIKLQRPLITPHICPRSLKIGWYLQKNRQRETKTSHLIWVLDLWPKFINPPAHTPHKKHNNVRMNSPKNTKLNELKNSKRYIYIYYFFLDQQRKQ